MKNNNETKSPVSHEKIYKIMIYVVFSVAGIFFVKNLITGAFAGMAVIGVGLAVLAAALKFMKDKNVDKVVRQKVISLSIIALVLMISLGSGESYSDDFPMMLAIIAMSGMYFEASITKWQIVLADIAFVIMYIVHPEKAGALGQYIMCMGVFTLAGCLFKMTIERGSAFISIADKRADDTEKLIEDMRAISEKMQEDFESSSGLIQNGTVELKKGSESITLGAGEVSRSCNEVQEKIRLSQTQIISLNDNVKDVESALSENKENMQSMTDDINAVGDIIKQTSEVFANMQSEMKNIAAFAKELGDIALRVNLLALNASIEVAHVGNTGVGFGAVANEMKELSDSSDKFARDVEDTVNKMSHEVEVTSQKFAGSGDALENSAKTMSQLQNSFALLIEKFDGMYENIEAQNETINEVDSFFGGLRGKVEEMSNYSEENKAAVNEIVEAMDLYSENIGRVIERMR